MKQILMCRFFTKLVEVGEDDWKCGEEGANGAVVLTSNRSWGVGRIEQVVLCTFSRPTRLVWEGRLQGTWITSRPSYIAQFVLFHGNRVVNIEKRNWSRQTTQSPSILNQMIHFEHEFENQTPTKHLPLVCETRLNFKFELKLVITSITCKKTLWELLEASSRVWISNLR